MRRLVIITISLLLLGCGREEPFAGIVVGKEYIPSKTTVRYNPAVKAILPSHQEEKYLIYVANCERVRAFDVEKDVYENAMLYDSLYYGRKK